MTVPTSLPALLRRAPSALACAALILTLAACGGGGTEANDTAAAATDAETADTAGDARRFTLWAPHEEALLRAEQRQLAPTADGSTVQLLVRLNPAAVLAQGRATMLAASGTGEAGDAQALQARQLAAKAAAVAGALQGVMAQSVLRVAPGAQLRQQFSHAVEGMVLQVPWEQAAAVADELARNPAIDGVEPDRALAIGQAAGGVRVLDSRAWGVDRIDQRARAFDSAFRNTLTGTGVNVYVLDTGINAHNEFGNRLVAGFGAVNDGRGTADCHGHGTHVAGTSAGATLGVAPGARLVPVRVMDCAGSGSGSALLAGLDWVAAKGQRPGVLNLSLGGSASATLDAAVQRLVTAGFSVVVAAGNSNIDACTQSPGRAAGVITVAASDTADAKASFSNWGACVALSAPGTAIASAGRSSASAVVAMSGTSMAAPHAAGAVALLLQASPSMAPAQVRQQLLAQATPDVVTGLPAGTPRALLYAGASAAPAAAALPVAVVQRITLTPQVTGIGLWRAAAELRVVDALGQPVGGAKVAGRFSNATVDTGCTTASSGSCTLTSANAAWSSVPTLGFAVSSVQAPGRAYTGGGERQAQVARPPAPVASIAALTGTQQRSTPTAADWVPAFTATVKDASGAPVSGATVEALLQVHSGATVVGARSVSCVTGSTGQCTPAWAGARLGAARTGATLQITGVKRNFLVYQPGALTRASVGRVQ